MERLVIIAGQTPLTTIFELKYVNFKLGNYCVYSATWSHTPWSMPLCVQILLSATAAESNVVQHDHFAMNASRHEPCIPVFLFFFFFFFFDPLQVELGYLNFKLCCLSLYFMYSGPCKRAFLIMCRLLSAL